MKFYLDGNPVDVLIGLSEANVLDTTLDSAKVTLKANDRVEPYKMDTTFKIEDDKGNTKTYIIASDVVTIASHSGIQRYIHTLSLVQDIRVLSKHISRNTVFTQPPTRTRKVYYSELWSLNDFAVGRDEKDNALQQYGYYPTYTIQITRGRSEIGTTQTPVKKPVFDLNSYYPWNDITLLNEKEKVLSVKAVLRTYTTNYGEEKTLSLTPLNEIFGYAYPYSSYKATLKDENGNSINIEVPSSGEVDISVEEFKKLSGKIYIDNGYSNGSIINDVPIFYNEDFGGTKIVTPRKFTSITFQLEIIYNVYYYSLYDVLSTLVKQYERDNEDTANYKTLFHLPTEQEDKKLYDLLTKTIAPNMSFTNKTFYECVQQVFDTFDSTPKFSSYREDGVPVIGADYLNQKLNNVTNKQPMVGMQLSLSEDKYINSSITNYQNAMLEHTYYPTNNGYAPLRNETYGVPTSDLNQWVFLTDKPINGINTCYVYVSSKINGYSPYGGTGSNQFTAKINLDISPFIFEYGVYSTLNVTQTFPYQNKYSNITQTNAMYYQRNGYTINVGGSYRYLDKITIITFWNILTSAMRRFFGLDTTSVLNNPFALSDEPNTYPITNKWQTIFMRLDYQSETDGRIKHQSTIDKYDGEIALAQSDGYLDLYKLGLNSYGKQLKMGEPSLTVNNKLYINSKNKKPANMGDYIKYGENEYIANVVGHTFFNDHITEKIEYVKNFNSMARFLSLDVVKRPTNIDKSLTNNCEEIFNDFLLYSTEKEDIDNIEYTKPIIIYTNINGQIEDLLGIDNANKNNHHVDYALLNTYDLSTENNKVVNQDVAKNLFLSLKDYSSNQTYCLECLLNDPINVGNSTTNEDGWFGLNKYFTKATKYTTSSGFFNSCDIFFFRDNGTPFSNNFPIIEEDKKAEDMVMGQLRNLKYFKKPNEIFGFNYCLHAIGIHNERDFLGEYFKRNFTLSRLKTTLENGKYKLWCSNTQLYDVISYKPLGSVFKDNLTLTATSGDFASDNDNSITITARLDGTYSVTLLSWAITTEDDQLIFYSNNHKKLLPSSNVNLFSFYFKVKGV